MTTPNPRTIYAELREAETYVHHDKRTCGTRDGRGRVVGCLACEYQWAHNAAYERSWSGSDVEIGKQKHSHGGAKAASAKEKDHAEVVLGPDSVGDLLMQKESMRRDVNRAASDLRRAVKDLRHAESALISAMEKAERNQKGDRVIGTERFPRTATIDDIAKAREAQARRRQAGEAIA